MFTAATATARYQPRPQDAPPELFQRRLEICQACQFRRGHTCTLKDQLAAILARPKAAACPNSSWPGDPPAYCGPTSAPTDKLPAALPRKPPLSVAVAVISPDYGRFVPEAIESLLAQTVPPSEILIIDDDERTNDTAAAAARYPNLRYIRLSPHRTYDAQRTAFEQTTAPILLFLDADDTLPPDYIEKGLPLFADQRVGLVYADQEQFGAMTGRITFDPPEKIDLANYNQCASACLVRRAALETSDAFDPGFALVPGELQDWFLWRKVVNQGWKLAKSSAVINYRRHPDSWWTKWQQAGGEKARYYHTACLAREPITLFIPLSGRAWAWPPMRDFLERQTWPADQTRLVLCDTSDDESFARPIRAWLAGSRYGDARYFRLPLPQSGMADQDRSNPQIRNVVNAIMPRIYNRMARECSTDYVWVVEDDVIPPPTAAETLMKAFEPNVASVSALYRDRRFPGKFVCWDRNLQLFSERELRQTGYRPTFGNGFGCVILRRSVLRDAVFTHAEDSEYYDVTFYRQVAAAGCWKTLLAPRVLCQHLDPP